MDEQPKRVKAQSIPRDTGSNVSKRELWATVCYHYPQYTLKEASRLPLRDIKLLLKIAEKIEAGNKHDLVQIVAAPHTKKGSGVKKLSEYYRKKAK